MNVKNGVVWSYCLGLYMFSLVFLLFPFLLSCLLCDSFCLLPFCLRFSVHLTFSFPICFFLLHFHVCQVSVFPPVISFRLQIVFFIILFAFSSGGFVFPSGFALWNEAKTKAKTKAKFTTISLAWTWPGAGKPSFPSCHYCENYHCHCGA